MSRTSTISSWSGFERDDGCCDGSSYRPLQISAYISATRRGVRASRRDRILADGDEDLAHGLLHRLRRRRHSREPLLHCADVLGDVGQVAITLVDIEPVADDELGWDPEPTYFSRTRPSARPSLTSSAHTSSEAVPRAFRFFREIGEGETGVDDVLRR